MKICIFRIELAVICIVLILGNIALTMEIKHYKQELLDTYKRLNNLLCDYDDAIGELQEVLTEYHNYLNDYQIPLIQIPQQVRYLYEEVSHQQQNDDW